jgi:prophage maintenance system killer protein
MTKEKKTYQPILSKNIYLAYELLLDKKFISFPLVSDSRKKIDAIVSNINNSYFGKEIYVTTEEKVVAYLYFLIKDHPFTDGNKRTACLIFEVACDINDLAPNFKDFTLDQLAVFIEKIKEENHQEIIRIISRLLF